MMHIETKIGWKLTGKKSIRYILGAHHTPSWLYFVRIGNPCWKNDEQSFDLVQLNGMKWSNTLVDSPSCVM